MIERLAQVIDINRRPERRAALIQRLVDIDQQLEPLEREAELLRRALGLIAIERGLDDEK